MKTAAEEKNSEKRDNPRIKYSGNVFFTTKDGFCEGILINYSEDGLFIRTFDIQPVGSIITIALPYLDGYVKRQGQIVRIEQNGFGVALFREDGQPFQKITPRAMKIT